MSEWKWTVYRTTNLVNGKTYVGSHKTKNPNDRYPGSGTLFRRSLLKYGRKNFVKDVLHIFDNKDDMFEMERNLVGIELRTRGDDCYNLLTEFEGNWTHSEITRSKLRDSKLGTKLSLETRKKVSDALRGQKRGPCPEDTKMKISKARKGQQLSPEALENLRASVGTDEARAANSERQKKWQAENVSHACIKVEVAYLDGRIEVFDSKSYVPGLSFYIVNRIQKKGSFKDSHGVLVIRDYDSSNPEIDISKEMELFEERKRNFKEEYSEARKGFISARRTPVEVAYIDGRVETYPSQAHVEGVPNVTVKKMLREKCGCKKHGIESIRKIES